MTVLIGSPVSRGVLRAKSLSGVTIVHDQFSDPDGTALTAHPIAPTNLPATSWTVLGGGAIISSNTAVENFGTSRIRFCGGLVSDGVVSADINNKVDYNANNGVACRVTDSDNGWVVAINGSSNIFSIIERNAGVDTVRASTAVAIPTGIHAISVTLSGNDITGTLNGGSSTSYSSSTFATNKNHGIRTTRYDLYSMDNFKVVG